MAYYYVSNQVGTLTSGDGGRTTTQRTGAFSSMSASEVYLRLDHCFRDSTTKPADGDIVFVADDHDYDVSASFLEIYSQSNSQDNGVYIICVSASDCTTASTGAKERTTSSFGFQGAPIYVYGMTFATTNQIQVNGSNSSLILENCNLELEGNGDYLYANNDGTSIRMYGGTLSYANGTNGIIRAVGGSAMHFHNVSFTGTGTPAENDYLIKGEAGNGGGLVYLEGCDLSGITNNIIGDHGGHPYYDDGLRVEMINCKLNSSVGWFLETLVQPETYVMATGCSSSSAGAEYAYHYEDFIGYVQDDLQYRDETTAWPSGEKTSLQVVTKTEISRYQPFKFQFPTRYAELSSASTDTVRIYFTSTDSSLTNKDVWAEVTYQDGTNNHTPNLATTKLTSPLATGTAISTDSSSTWKTSADADLTGHTEYYIDVSTTGDAGADCVPLIKVCIGKASTTLYFDTTVDLV